MTNLFYVSYGFANRFNQEICLNKHLKKEEYRELHDWIVEHELSHDSGLTSINDLKLDMSDYLVKPQVVSKQYFSFFFKHPSSWVQVSPVLVHKSFVDGDVGLYWDWYRIIGIIVLAVFIWFLWWRFL